MSDIGRSNHRRPNQLSLLAATLVLVLVSACAPTSAGLMIPVSGAPEASFRLQEYPLVEQSSDNPTHPGFIEHVPEGGIARRLAQPESALLAPNQTLAQFGYHLEMSVAAPYQAYSLYQGETLVQDDILHYWPVTLNATGSDFLLPFETLDGTRRVISLSGIADWPGANLQKTSPPIFIGDRLAYAAVSDSQLSVQAGGQVLYRQPDPLAVETALVTASTPGKLSTWDGHWALELDGRVIVDGKDLNDSLNADHIFLWHMIQGQPFFLYLQNGLTRVSFGGETLPFVYDAIVSGDSPETALFRPGSSDNVVWFFALRDGLWYYVEAGLIPE